MKKDLKSLIILFKAQTSVQNSVKKSLEQSGINMNEFVAMEALYTKERLTTHQLAELILIPNSSLTYVIDILMEKNYVRRDRCDDDKRILYVSLTSKGKQFFESVYEKHYSYIRPIFDELSEDEEEKLRIYLKKIGKYAKDRNEK